MSLFRNGFSLVEMLWVLVIMVIVLLIAIPTCQFIFKKSEQQVIETQLVRALALTRAEAMNRKMPVTLCSSVDKKNCGGSWLDGYIVLAGHDVLAVFQNEVHQGKLNWNAALARKKIVYDKRGFTHAGNGTFWYCPENAEYPTRAVVLNKIGRVYVVSEARLRHLKYRCGGAVLSSFF